MKGQTTLRLPTHGFTLVELLVCIAIISALAGLLLPALIGGKSSARIAFCLNNKKQLDLAWITYAGDNRDHFAYNSANSAELGGYIPEALNWAYPYDGWNQMAPQYMNWTTDEINTNVDFMIGDGNSSMAAYLKYSASLLHCPEDTFLSAPQIAAGWTQRVRSVSMNFFLGDGWGDGGGPKRLGSSLISIQFSDLRALSPAMAFVFLDEHPDTICYSPKFDEFFYEPAVAKWCQLPASYHAGGCTLCFADGHAEYKKWLVPQTRQPVTFNDLEVLQDKYLQSSDVRDHHWLAARTFANGDTFIE
jgi:prepilin-type N-terminal cleavage/methylation domain-containing protein/prepilin-type processing-associated H-X9-DG protein